MHVHTDMLSPPASCLQIGTPQGRGERSEVKLISTLGISDNQAGNAVAQPAPTAPWFLGSCSCLPLPETMGHSSPLCTNFFFTPLCASLGDLWLPGRGIGRGRETGRLMDKWGCFHTEQPVAESTREKKLQENWKTYIFRTASPERREADGKGGV